MDKHHYATIETYMPGPDGRPTDFGELLTDISLEHSSQHLSISSSAPPTTGSAAGVIAARVLAVLVVAMVITSIIGFTIFDRQAG
jgi:hypothetical protein